MVDRARFIEPDEEQEVSGTITITFKVDASFPMHWDRSEIYDYICDNPTEFMSKIIEVDDVSI